MPETALVLTLTIPEVSSFPTPSPAIGLTEAVHQQDSANPFDLAEALIRSAQAVTHPSRESVPPEPQQQTESNG